MNHEKTTAAEAGPAVDTLRRKYLKERDIRLRSDGNSQYIVSSGEFERYRQDINAPPSYSRGPLERDVTALVLGGGFSGLITAARLREQGIEDLAIIEKAGDFGGTWYWNRYPGARCDTESYIYLPLLEETGYIPSEKYVTGSEIFEYTRILARHFDLYAAAIFRTEVRALEWNEERGHWIVSTDRGDLIRARFLCIGSGVLNRPKLPGIPGIKSFKGQAFHTARWDYGYTGGGQHGSLERLKDKRVGIIGTGSTAVQVVPHVGAASKELYVFQRTPPAVDERNNEPTDAEWMAGLQPGWQRRRMDSFDLMLSGRHTGDDFVSDGWTKLFNELRASGDADFAKLPDNEKVQILDYRRQERIRARVDRVVRDPVVAESLKPWYGAFCKRQVFHDEYLETFNRPNVFLVDTRGVGVAEITEEGVVVDGKEYKVDCLIYSTGFEVTNDWCHSADLEIVGRNGTSLAKYWKDEFRTYLGIYVRDFPNMFIVSGPQAGRSVNYPTGLDAQARHIAATIRRCLDGGVRAITPRPEAEDRWLNQMRGEVRSGVASLLPANYFEECTPGYHNNEGQLDRPVSTFFSSYPGGPYNYRVVLKAWGKNALEKDMEILS